LVIKDHKVLLETKVLKVLQEKVEHKVQQEHKVQPEQKALKELQELQEQVEPQAQ
jgi:hypothetical protein